MELLRECYKEKGIKNVNAAILDKRNQSISKVIENELLDQNEWEILLKWVIGIECKETEDVLIKLEETFCELDVDFSKDKLKEMQVLAENLLYEYCIGEGNIRFPLMILCGYNIDYKIKSEIVYRLFHDYISDLRLEKREHEEVWNNVNLPDAVKLKKIIAAGKKEAEACNEEFSYTAECLDEIVDLLDSFCDFSALMDQREKYLKNDLEAQREESNILWWMINGWSEIYQTSFDKLKSDEIVLAAPIELQKMVRYDLGPYAARQVLYRIVSMAQLEKQKITLAQVVDHVKEDIYDRIDFEQLDICEVQPILLALKCRREGDETIWGTLYFNKCGKKIEQFEMGAQEFAYQFYLELELAKLSEEW